MVDKNIQLKIHTGNGNFDELFPVTKAELVEVNGKKLSESLNDVTAQLAQTTLNKADWEDVYLKQNGININDFDDETRETFLDAQGIDVNYILGEKNVEPINTTFFITGKNLFNKKTATAGYVLNPSTGVAYVNSGYYTSEFIAVESNSAYTLSHLQYGVFYDGNKEYISSIGSAKFTTSPETKYIRVSMGPGILDSYQVEKGSATTYEPFIQYIPNDLLEFILPPIGYEDVDFLTTGKNLFDKTAIHAGMYVNELNGNLVANPVYDASQYISVKPNTTYSMSSSYRYALYNKDKVFVSGGNNITTFTTGATASFIRCSTQNKDTFQLEESPHVTPYEPFGFQLKNQLSSSDESKNIALNLPAKIYTTVNQDLKIFFESIVPNKAFLYNFESPTARIFNKYLRINQSTSGNSSLTVNLFDGGTNLDSKRVDIIASNKRTTPIKVLVIGDSLINAGIPTKRIKDTMGSLVTLIGSRSTTGGSDNNYHEGRGGWQWSTYRTSEVFYDVVNPFYSPTTGDFDFAHYLTTTGFAKPDVVIFNLGVNDVFGLKNDAEVLSKWKKVKADIDFITGNIVSYDSTIKVALNVPTPPTGDVDLFALKNGNVQWRQKYNNYLLAQLMIKEYNGIRDLIATYAPVNPETDYVDHVHLNDNGYYQMGDQMMAYLNSI